MLKVASSDSVASADTLLIVVAAALVDGDHLEVLGELDTVPQDSLRLRAEVDRHQDLSCPA